LAGDEVEINMHSIESVSDWLRRLGYERFIPEFEANEIDADILSALDINDLVAMQIPIGPAKKILRAIEELTLQTENPSMIPAPTDVVSGDAPDTNLNPMVHDVDRRQVTVMFCDMVGSTSLSAQLDPEDLSAVMLSFLECCTDTARRYDAHVANYLGDGLLIYFGYPHARENDAERALRVALEMLRDVSKLKLPHDVKVSMRIGIATGMVVGGEMVGAEASGDRVVMGDTPNLAARIQAIAEPDTILVAAQTMKLAGTMFEYVDVGTQQLKGFERAVPVYQVVGERRLDSRFNIAHPNTLLPMVGREHELALILERYSQCCAGDGQVVVITAEAGLGKSRIARAVIDSLPQPDQPVINFQCTPYYEQSALYPIVQYFMQLSGIQNTDTAETSYQKLCDALRRAGETDSVNIGVIAQIMALGQDDHPDVYNMPAQQRRARLLDTLVAFLLRIADKNPLVILIEDIHWIDPTTRLLFEMVIESIDDKQVLVLATERPHDNSPYFSGAITSRIALNRLGRKAVVRLIQGMTGHLPLSDDIITEIAQKTDGIPLFAEEITKAAIESEHLYAQNQPEKPLHKAIKNLAIPSSLHDSLMERLDRLSVVREYVQVCSVLGREFDYALLASTLGRPESEITAALEQLVSADLLSCVGRPPNAIYSFKHSLIRDAAYESMLNRRRHHWHLKVANTLEEEFPTIVESEPEILAQHYASCDFTERSTKYWVLAADLSLKQFNLFEAVEKSSNGLQQSELLESSPLKDELSLRLQLGRALALRGINGFTDPGSALAFEAAMTLARSLEDWDRYVAAARGLCVSLYIRGMLPKAHDLAQRIVFESSEPRHLVDGHLTMGQVLYYQGQPKRSKEHLEKALEFVDGLTAGTELSQQFDERCAIEQFLQKTLDLTGKIKEALVVADRAYERARDLAQPLAIAGTLCHLCLLKIRLKITCIADVETLLAHTEKYKLSFWKIWAEYCSALAGDKPAQDAHLKVRQAREQLQSMGVKLGLSSMMVAETRLLLSRNDPTSALQLIDVAKIYVKETTETYYESEIIRLEGDVRLATNYRDLAEDCFRRALEIAASQNALWWQLRAATSLYSLCDDSDDWRQTLESVANQFTGLDLPDIRKAKRLLSSSVSDH